MGEDIGHWTPDGDFVWNDDHVTDPSYNDPSTTDMAAGIIFWLIVFSFCLVRKRAHVASASQGSNVVADYQYPSSLNDRHHDVEDIAYGATKGEDMILVDGQYISKAKAGVATSLIDAGHIDHPSNRGCCGFIGALIMAIPAGSLVGIMIGSLAVYLLTFGLTNFQAVLHKISDADTSLVFMVAGGVAAFCAAIDVASAWSGLAQSARVHRVCLCCFGDSKPAEGCIGSCLSCLSHCLGFIFCSIESFALWLSVIVCLAGVVFFSSINTLVQALQLACVANPTAVTSVVKLLPAIGDVTNEELQTICVESAQLLYGARLCLGGALFGVIAQVIAVNYWAKYSTLARLKQPARTGAVEVAAVPEKRGWFY